MTTAIAYNTFGTKESRVVAEFDANDMNDAVRIAAEWNKDETRSNMRVNFVAIGAMLRPLADVSLPLFDRVA